MLAVLTLLQKAQECYRQILDYAANWFPLSFPEMYPLLLESKFRRMGALTGDAFQSCFGLFPGLL